MPRARKSLPVVWQRIPMLGSDDESASELILPDFLSPEGSQNFRLTKIGLAESVEGYSTLNATAIITNGGSSVVKVVGLYHYRSIASGTVTRREVAVVDDGTNEYEIHHSTNGGSTWSFLKDLGSGAVNLRVSFAQYENTLIMCFGGSIVPQTYDGSSVSVAGATQPSAPTAVAGSTGTNLTGVYAYKVAIIDSSGDIGPASAVTTEITVENLDIDLSSVPTGPGGTLGRRIFRTTGDGKVFFKVGDIDDNAATTFNDNVTDKTLLDNPAEIQEHGDPPPTGAHFCVSHRSRVFYLGTNANPNRFFYSDIGKPESVGPGSFERVGEGEQGDLLTGGFPEFEGELVLTKERSMWVLQGSSRANFNLIRAQASIGAVHELAMAAVPGGATYTDLLGQKAMTAQPSIVMITAAKDIRLFDGASDIIISRPKQDTLATMSYKNRAKAWAVPFPDYGSILFGIPTSDDTDPTMSYFMWDHERGVWPPIVGFPPGASAVLSETATAGSVLMVGEGLKATGGKIYQFFTGSDLDGSDMTVTFRTRPMTGGKEQIIKMLRGIVPLFKSTVGSVTVTIKVYKGFADTGATAFSTHTRDIQATNANLDEPDPIYIKNTSGEYPVAKAFVIEFTITGTTKIGLHGWLQGIQFWPRDF